MALRASQTRIIPKKYLIGAIVLVTLISYITCFGIWMMRQFDNNNLQDVHKCLIYENQTQQSLIWKLSRVIVIIITGSGLFFDMKMFLFIKVTFSQKETKLTSELFVSEFEILSFSKQTYQTVT